MTMQATASNLDAYIRQYQEILEIVNAEISKLNAIEEKLFGYSEYRNALNDVDYARSRALEKLVSEARIFFAPDGCRLKISCGDVCRSLEENGKNPRNMFDVLEHLEQTYGGAAGADMAYRQQAISISRMFKLHHDTAIRQTGKGVVLSMYVCSEESFRHNGMRKIGWSSMPDFNALLGFAHWSGMTEFLGDMEAFQLLVANANFVFLYRDKYEYKSLKVTTFKDKWDFLFPHDVADKLKQFLGLYAS